MTTTATSSTLAPPTTALNAQNQADFYAKLLHLQRDVLTGQHPRYNFPSPVLAQHGFSRSTSGKDNRPVSKCIVSESTQAKTPATYPHPIVNGATGSSSSKAGTSTSTNPVFPGSGINPVLLSKADHLVKAENNLKRLRTEKALRDAAKFKNTSSGEKDTNPWFGAHTFDCSQLLSAAVALVKPVSGFHTSTANEDRDSGSPPNTASYYSSKVDSGSEKDRRSQKDGPIDASASVSFEQPLLLNLQRPNVSGLGPGAPQQLDTRAMQLFPLLDACTDIHIAAEEGQIEQSRRQSLRDVSYSPPSPDALPWVPNSRPPLEKSKQDGPRGQALSNRGKAGRPHTGRTRESGSYSPPPVIPGLQNNPPPGQNGPPTAPSWNGPPPGARPLRRKNQEQPLGQIPNKKQPKGKKGDNKKNNHAPPPPPQRLAVNGHVAPQNPRKRRREPEPEDQMRRVSGRTTAAVSPEPYIKPEPISPRLPPVTNGAAPPRRVVLRDDGTADIQLDGGGPYYSRREPPQHEAVLDRRDFPSNPPPRHAPYVDDQSHTDSAVRLREPMYVEAPNHPATPMRRRIVRDDGDLRRVASYQYARRAASPSQQEDVSPREVRYVHAPSRHVSGAAYRESYDDDHYLSRQIAPARRQSPMVVHEDYVPRTPMHVPPPPKRRIVIDEDGNEYIAIPAGHSLRQSAAPTPEYRHSIYEDAPRYQEQRTVSARPPPMREPVYEQQPTARARRSQVIELLDDDDDCVPTFSQPRNRRVAPDPEYDYAPPAVGQQQTTYFAPPAQHARTSSAMPASARRVMQQPQYAHDPDEFGGRHYNTRPLQQEQPAPQQRAYSARPDLVQQHHGIYDVEGGSWADQLDARLVRSRMY